MGEFIYKLTGKGNRAGNGEYTGFAAKVTELAVGVTGEDFAAVAAEEFDDGDLGEVRRGSDHDFNTRVLLRLLTGR